MDLKREEESVSFSVKHAFKVKAKSKAGDTWVDVLDEVWAVTVHQTPEDHFLFDIVSVQQCVSDKPLRPAKYHYGGMAIRGNYQWLKEKEDHSITPDDVEYLTSDGKDRWEGNHTRPNWVAFSGRLDGRDVSAAIFCSPENFVPHNTCASIQTSPTSASLPWLTSRSRLCLATNTFRATVTW